MNIYVSAIFQDAKKKLSARMNGLDKSLDEFATVAESTREEVNKAFTISSFVFFAV